MLLSILRILVSTITLALCLIAATLPRPACAAGGNGVPKSSQHASFNPKEVERLAVIVKSLPQERQQQPRFGPRVQAADQSQCERLIEQGFMRVILGKGYTVVSRADLDAIIKEKGLDQANLTDEKLTAEAGKWLHVPAIVIVSVDAMSVTPLQAPGRGFAPMQRWDTPPALLLVASVSARLVRIDNNMVLWTGDMTINQTVTSQNQDSVILSSMAQSIAELFPPFAEKKKL
jgi:hypothetical protein